MSDAPAPPPVGRALSSAAAGGAWVWDFQTNVFHADVRFAGLTGLDPERAAAGTKGASFFHGIVAEDLPRVKIAVAAIRRGAESFLKTYRVRDGQGVVRWVSARGRSESDAAGEVVRFSGELTDITELKRVELQLRVAQSAGGVGTFEYVDGYGTASVSEQFCRLLGLHPTDALPLRTVNAVVAAGEPPLIQGAGRTGAQPDAFCEIRIRRADDGDQRWMARRGEYRDDGLGGGPRFIGVIYDITSAKRSEQKLQELTQTLEARVQERTRERDRIWRRSLDLIAVLGRDGALRSVNPAWTKVLRYGEAALLGRPLLTLIHPEDATAARLALGAPSDVESLDLRLCDADGGWRHLNWTFVSEEDAIYATGRDVTERLRLEDQLRQSQKMEAVGQLTGGIAHDFNNMLTGIISGVALARRRWSSDREEEASRFLDAVVSSAERAAALTHRLLAFSRRQTLNPQSVDVGELARSMEDLLRRTLGESIALAVQSRAEIWPARCDANQLESALLNFAINARDAMPDGGELEIGCENCAVQLPRKSYPDTIQPGEYVVVSIADTGVGMSEAVKSKVFDPFFTTKPIGKGTGLGLSMVYGFVRQSGGNVEIESAPDRGTTIKLYLPKLGDAAQEATPHTVEQPAQAKGERVLIVEDGADVKMMTSAVLSGVGYRVTATTNADAALEILRRDGSFALLITDVGLPGINGRQLADLARELHPGLPVLFVTGYAGVAAVSSDFLDVRMHMISKPFNEQSLTSAVRAALEA